MDLTGRSAIVTGAARGIGRAIARTYAAEGARVALVDVLADELQHTAAEIARDGGRYLAVPADITDASDVEAMAARVEKEFGGVDILVEEEFHEEAATWRSSAPRTSMAYRTQARISSSSRSG